MNAAGGGRYAGPFWRVFPWNPTAADGAPFSPRYVQPPTRNPGGRFTFHPVPALYLAETPEHALAEVLRRLTGEILEDRHLTVADRSSPGAYHRLSVVRAWLPEPLARNLPDLCDGATLHRFGIRPDALASADRRVTQPIARDLHTRGLPGFRWWSAIHGDWHVTVLFLDRVDVATIRYDAPEPLTLQHSVARSTARLLKMRIP